MALKYEGDVDELIEELSSMPFVVFGTGAKEDFGRIVMTAIGFAAISDLHKSFVTKSRGGTDEMGVKWPKLSPVTIANRKVGKDDVFRGRSAKGGAFVGGRYYHGGQYLPKNTIQEREKIRKAEFRKALKRLMVSMPEADARARAERVAQHRTTQLTGLSKLHALGSRDVEILRDTGVMLSTLTPGVFRMSKDSVSYDPPDGQIFNVSADKVVIASSDPRVAMHDKGNPKRNLPRRQIFPGDDEIPEAWLQNWCDAGAQAVLVMMNQTYGR